jgi:hypothetical protein
MKLLSNQAANTIVRHDVGLSAAFSQLAEELRRQYSIGYYPPQVRPVNVVTSSARQSTGLLVKARGNYIYAKPSAKESKP